MELAAPGALQRLSISYDQMPGFGPAWRAVVSEHPDSEWLYARSPANPEACRAAAQERLSSFKLFAELAEILRSEGKLYGLPDETLARLSFLEQGKAVVVATGQQVGYLGGPLFTFLKAYHTMRMARALEATLRLPVLPVFWLEGEDHDLAEIRASHFPQSDGTIGSIEFTPDQEIPNQEVGRYVVNDSALAGVHELLSKWEQVSGEAAEALEHSYSESDLSTAMGRFLAATLGPRGLLICEGRHEGLKRLAQPLWERVIDKAHELSSAFHARSDEVRVRGYNANMHPTPDAHFFYLADKHFVRHPVQLDGTIKCPDGRTTQITNDELKAKVRAGEWTISPKAGLRPLYQDYVLPTIAYVGGPGELDYHAQLAPFYSLLNVPAPSLFPRLSATFLDAKTDRLREKLSLSWEELFGGSEHELIKQLMRDADEHDTAKRFAETKSEIEANLNELRDTLRDLDPTLEGALDTTIGKALHPLEHLEGKANKAIKQKHAVELARLQKVLFAVKPNGKPMERALGTAWALLHYGVSEFLDMLDQLPADGAAHHVVITE
ncbi:MAG: bacillithiol biosynthesis cysteine-adding enzyme BshC [Calditrichaeota bacterium]|nr:bacillithiol biosynthesis cysteine-adding enzyme BshC [Calditrichota bacterium]